jgi:hypothetical protein
MAALSSWRAPGRPEHRRTDRATGPNQQPDEQHQGTGHPLDPGDGLSS